ncbi:hypothetical protein L7F22_061584 [Adiantum nelumboides]|nr:hypothetical protein [Adiantum nelumboides]
MENLSSSFGTSREGSEASSDNVQDRCLLDCLVHLQATLDHHRASIKLQDDILRVLFEGLCPSKGKKSIGNNPKPCLASLLIKKSVDWNGCLDGTPIPSNFSKLLRLYKEKGMVSPQEWKLCIGNDTLTHDPQLLHPSLEDVEEAEGLKCLCEDSVSLRMLKRDCQRCCERCPTCSKPRKEMIKFHYIPLIEQLKKLCLSESYCHDFLGMWRARSSWLGKEVAETPTYIHEFWDGEKTRLYQEFWDPDAYWEAPVLCCNEFCNMSYRAFPTALKSQELHSAWNECSKEYIFKCTKCRHPIKRKQQFVKGDPRNFALMLHWDGFQAASTTIKDSAVVEVVVLNGGDHPAQCKLGQLKDGGKSFCRRDKAHVTLVEEAHGGRYVYDRNRYQGRYPLEKRKVQDMWDAIRASKRCATKERKEDMLQNAGLSGVSILWRLYHLYGFDISRDLVYDVVEKFLKISCGMVLMIVTSVSLLSERGIIVIYNIHLVAMIGTKEESFMLHQRSKLEKLQLDVIDYFHVAVPISFIRKVGSVRAENIQPIGFQYAKVFFKEDSSKDVSPNGSLKVDNDLHSFLNDHADLLIDDTPREFPLKRGDDNHRIDLIPRSSLPNKLLT